MALAQREHAFMEAAMERDCAESEIGLSAVDDGAVDVEMLKTFR